MGKQVIEEIFQVPIRDEDLDYPVSGVMEWSSFEILSYMVEMSDRYGTEITVERISEVETVRDLLQLTEECCLQSPRGK